MAGNQSNHSFFITHTQHIQKMLSCITHLSFAVNAWISPNMTAFMAITAHGISPKWNIVDLLVAMPAVKGTRLFLIFY
ncbi:uncharacterized protein VP01_406g5 [Puccinia sorghi]|uniref:Uncharacterized protein n=1 Tax=Puccinia sorghi TaxID=27349 RepID=A0A0L6URK0_9BASI|nr:uncharacterized protein VP01_406g5 [Puccinia sorghi]